MSEDHIDADIARVASQVEQTGQRAAARIAGTGPVLGRARSADGAVDVQVIPGGTVHQVRISQQALRLGSQAIAAEVLRLAERATRDAAGRLHHTLHGVLDAKAVKGLTELGLAPHGPDDEGEDHSVLRSVL